MFFYFPGNYTWSYSIFTALRCGGQLGEMHRWLAPLAAMPDAGTDDWAKAWTGMAAQQVELAERDLARGHEIGAGERYLRAALYSIVAERQIPPGPAKDAAYAACREGFATGLRLTRAGYERVEIPSPDGPLPGYLIPAGVPRAPLMIFFDGFDSTKEIMTLAVRNQFARRGVACLVVESPGVGEPLRLRGVPSRPDYEVVAGAIIDWAETRADLDASRIGVMGISLGGYYAPRAAAFEPRIKCCVAWGAMLDYGATWRNRVVTGSKETAVPRFQLPWVMGTKTFEEAVERVQQWTLVDVLPKLRQPFLILHGENDRQVPLADARRAFELAGSADKELRIFTAAEGGAEHCQTDEPQAAINLIADWSVQKLAAAR